MLITLLYLIAGAFINGVTAVFALANYNAPLATLFTAMATMISYLGIFRGIVDLPAAFTAASIAVGFEIFWFGFLITWYVVGFFRAMLTRGNSH